MVSPIRSEEDLTRALERVQEILHAEEGTKEVDELEILVVLIQDYEYRHHSIPPGDPGAILRYKMKERGLSFEDLGRETGWPLKDLARILEGSEEITLKKLLSLCKILELDPRIFVGGP